MLVAAAGVVVHCSGRLGDHAQASGLNMGDTVEKTLTAGVGSAAGLGSRDELVEMVELLYDRVRRLSAAELRKAFPLPLESLTVQPTAIAHDAILRVLRQRGEIANEDQFFALATRFIRQLIGDYRRHRLAEKRGAGRRGVSIEQAEAVADEADDPDAGDAQAAVVRLLERLHDAYPRKAEVVSLHVLCGHPLPRVSSMLGISQATVERDWAFAKAWLADEITGTTEKRA